jgi:hypothetical protein
MEGLNNKIKVLKRQAYGFRNMAFFKLRLYFLHETSVLMPGCRFPGHRSLALAACTELVKHCVTRWVGAPLRILRCSRFLLCASSFFLPCRRNGMGLAATYPVCPAF